MASHHPLRPVIVISGANSGAGFGLAQRLLVQLSSPTPPDTVPVHPQLLPPGEKPVASPFSASHGCVLIMACRNAIKAHRARAQLQSLLRYLEELPDDAETPQSVPASVLAEPLESKVNGMIDEDADPALVAQAMEASLRRRRRRTAAVSLSSEEGGEEDRDLTRDPRTGRTYTMYERDIRARGRYRRRFCSQTVIEIQALDLGSMASALNCAKEITARHQYVTHVVMNAGSSAFTGINWPYAVWMMIINFHKAVTYPQYKLQRAGDIGKDGHGWVWQANVGAHYVLARALLPALRATPYSTPSRIIWTGSLEAKEDKYTPSDFQCIKTSKPYESSKYQCELTALGMQELLDRSRLRTQPGTPLPLLAGDESTHTTLRSASGKIEPASYLTHPGVVASSIFAECLNAFLSAAMKIFFYLARYTFSKHHNIDGYKGAVAASHVCLAPSRQLESCGRYGSQSDFFGREYVFNGRVDGWYANRPSGSGLKEKQRLFAASKDEGLIVDEGDYVRALARDLLVKFEGVAKQVWKEAREGALPPFNQIDDDEGLGIDASTRDVKEAKLEILNPDLLPVVDQDRKFNPASASTKNGSLSSQESWEKIDDAI